MRILDAHIVQLPAAVLAVVQALGRDLALIQRGSHKERLDGGPHLQRVRSKPVPPTGGRISCVGVGVEGRIFGPCQNVSGAHIGHDHAAPVCLKGGYRLRERLLREILYLGIQREPDVLPVNGAVALGTVQVQPPPRGIALYHKFGILPAQQLVLRQFQSFQPLVVHTHKPHQPACKLVVGIQPAVLRGQIHAGKFGIAYGSRRAVAYPAGYPCKLAALGELGPHVTQGQVQCLGEHSGSLRHVLHFHRTHKNGLARHTARKHLPVAVQNGATAPGDQFRGKMLALGHARQFRAPVHLHVKGPPPQRHPQKAEHHAHKRKTKTPPVATAHPLGSRLLGRLCARGYAFSAFEHVALRCNPLLPLHHPPIPRRAAATRPCAVSDRARRGAFAVHRPAVSAGRA